MTKRIIKWLVLFNIVALTAYGAKLLYAQQQKAAAQKRHLEQVAHNEEVVGFMTHQDYLKFAAVNADVRKNGRISDQDLDWAISVLRHPPLKNTYLQAPLRRNTIMHLLFSIKQAPPEQKNKIFDATLPLFHTKDDTDTGLDRVGAASVMMRIKDKRAIPYLLPLLKDTRPAVKRSAQKALNALGYKSPS